MFSLLPGVGFEGFIVFVVIVIVGGMVWRGRRNEFVAGTYVVVRKFKLSESPSSKVVVDISGRVAGIVSWVLTLLRLDPGFEFQVTDTEVHFHTGSLSGFYRKSVPLQKVTATVCGYQRSVLAFGFAILFAIGFVFRILGVVLKSIFPPQTEVSFFPVHHETAADDLAVAVVYLVLGGIAALIYYFSKRVGLRLEGRPGVGIVFKRSVIENVSVDLAEALRAAELINNRVLSVQPISSLTGMTPPQTAPRSAATEVSQTAGRCPKCLAANPDGVRFCENCGAPLNQR